MGDIDTRYSQLIVFMFFVAVSLAGCAESISEKPDIPCNVLLVTPFQGSIGQPLESENALRLIESQFDVESDFVTVTEYPDINEWDLAIRWPMDGLDIVLFSKEGNLARIDVEPTHVAVKGKEIISCIGSNPEWYRATYGPKMERSGIDFLFEMWFPDHGIVTQSSGKMKSVEELSAMNPDTDIRNFFIVRPGSPEELLLDIGHPLSSFEDDAWSPQSWPEDWQKVEFVQGW